MKDLEAEIKAYLVERNWYGLAPADLAKSVMIEGAELLELFQWKNHSISDIDNDSDLRHNIQKELADVMIYAIELAVHLDIDVATAIKEKLEHNRQKYPAEKMRDTTSGSEYYMQQKLKYRAAGK